MKRLVVVAIVCIGVLFFLYPIKSMDEIVKPESSVETEAEEYVPLETANDGFPENADDNVDSGGAKGYHGYMNPKPHYTGNPNNQFDNYDRGSYKR